MTERPLVTVAVPCFNDAGYLAGCLDSLVAQTHERWEAFVVDDGSTEGDVAAAAGSLPDERIRVIRHEENRGLAAARNTGIRGGTGPLVFPLDCDDELEPRCLEVLVAWLESNPGADAVFPDFQHFGAAGDRVEYRVRDTGALLVSQWIPGPGTLLRRTLFDVVGGYHEAFRAGNEDWDFWLAAVEAGAEIGHAAEALYRYRRHKGSLSFRQHRNEHATRELMYERHRALFDRFGAGDRFRAEGYRRSAVAELSQGRYLRAASHTARGLVLAPRGFAAGMTPYARGAFRRLRRAP